MRFQRVSSEEYTFCSSPLRLLFESASTAVRLAFESASRQIRDWFETGSTAVRPAFCMASAASEQHPNNTRKTVEVWANLVRSWYEFGTLMSGKIC